MTNFFICVLVLFRVQLGQGEGTDVVTDLKLGGERSGCTGHLLKKTLQKISEGGFISIKFN